MSKIEELLKNEKVEWKKLGDVCEDKFWIMPSTPKFSNDFKIPYITGKNIKNGEIDFDNVKYISEEDYVSFNKNRSIIKDDILISMIGTIGEIGVVKENNKFYGQNLYLLRLNPNIILTRYFYHFFSQNRIKDGLVSKKNNSSQGYIRAGNIENLEIPIPSIETQERIVKTLDKFTNYVTELQAELQARTKQYEYYRDMLLSEEYLNKISAKINGLVSKDYELILTTLGEIGEIQMCKRILKEQTSSQGEVPFYKIGTFGKEADSFISQDLFREYREKYNYPKNGEILLSASGTIGKTVIFDGEDAYFQDSNIVWISHNERLVLNKYLYYFYQIVKWNPSSGGTINRLYNYNLKNIKITLPPIEIQNKIVEILDKFQSLLADTKGLLPQEIEQRQKQYEYYREKLLTFNENSAKREREREYLSNSYLNSLKEAGEIVGVSVFGVEQKKLGEVCEVLDSKRKPITKSQRISGDYPYYGANGIQDYVDGYIFDGTYILMGEDGSVINKDGTPVLHWVDNRKIWVNNHAHILGQSCNIYNLKYIYYYLSSYNVSEIVKGTPPKINQENMKKIRVLIPSIKVQEHIVSILDKFDTLVNDISKGLPKEIELRQKQYEYYREKLLSFNR